MESNCFSARSSVAVAVDSTYFRLAAILLYIHSSLLVPRAAMVSPFGQLLACYDRLCHTKRVATLNT